MSVSVLMLAVSPHLFRGAHAVMVDGVLCDVFDAFGNALLGPPPDLPATAAPAIQTPPVIARSGTVMDGPPGTAAGIPAPEASFQWLDGDEPIAGATGSAFDDQGVEGQYRRRTMWSNGVPPAAQALSNAIAVTASGPAPTLTVLEPTRIGYVVESLGPVPDVIPEPTSSGYILKEIV